MHPHHPEILVRLRILGWYISHKNLQTSYLFDNANPLQNRLSKQEKENFQVLLHITQIQIFLLLYNNPYQ